MRISFLKNVNLRHLISNTVTKSNICVLLLITPLLINASQKDNNFTSADRNILDARIFTVDQSRTSLQSGSLQLQLNSFDQTMLLNLTKNTKLVEKLQNYEDNGVIFYKGKIEGIDDSWVRLNQNDGAFNGAIYDGNELYLVDELSVVKDSLVPWLRNDLASSNARSIIYRLSDTTDTATCGIDDSNINKYQSFISELQDLASEASNGLLADLQVNTVIVADTQYVASSNGNTQGQVLSQMNIVDGIFSEQVGVQFGIQQIIALSNNGPLTSTNPSTLLNAFRSYVNSQIGNPGVAHLFSGKNLNGNVIGIAYLRALCTTSGVGVTQAGGRGTTGALTAAHEFGHNFGAPHDNQGGSPCASTPGNFLMNPSINGSDTFSQCSLSQIAPIVNGASCLVDVGDPTPTPDPAPNCRSGAINFNNTQAYSANNTGSFNVSSNGCTIDLTGNIWRITQAGFDINANTSVTFDFTAGGTGEIQGVGFDEDTSASDNRIFRLAGTQNWGLTGFSYTGNGSPQRFTIPVGQFYTGNNLGFVIANDKDSGAQNNSVRVSNVVFSGGGPVPPGECIDLENVVPFTSTNTGSFSASGCNINLQGNIWRRTNQTFTISSNSVLTFNFSSNGTGEIHGIGFDQDNTASSNRVFKLIGSQNWGIDDFSYNGGNQSFSIPVGQYFTGSGYRLILVNDKDAGTQNNQTSISNIRLSN